MRLRARARAMTMPRMRMLMRRRRLARRRIARSSRPRIRLLLLWLLMMRMTRSNCVVAMVGGMCPVYCRVVVQSLQYNATLSLGLSFRLDCHDRDRAVLL